MTKCEVEFDGDKVLIGDFEVVVGVCMCDVYKDHIHIDSFRTLEQAIKYCLEN